MKVSELLEVLEEAQEDAYILTAKHLPWGAPEMGPHRDSSLLLLQQDFINGEARVPVALFSRKDIKP